MKGGPGRATETGLSLAGYRPGRTRRREWNRKVDTSHLSQVALTTNGVNPDHQTSPMTCPKTRTMICDVPHNAKFHLPPGLQDYPHRQMPSLAQNL